MKSLLATMLLLVPLAAGCGDDETTPPTTSDKDVSDILALQGNVMDGQAVYEDSCAEATCHGPNGNDGHPTAGDLTEEVPQRSDEELAMVIRYGTIVDGGTMAATNLPAQDIADVITYLRQTFPAQ